MRKCSAPFHPRQRNTSQFLRSSSRERPCPANRSRTEHACRRDRERSGGQTPILATILVGDDPASATLCAHEAERLQRVGMNRWPSRCPRARPRSNCWRRSRNWNANPRSTASCCSTPCGADRRALPVRRDRRWRGRRWRDLPRLRPHAMGEHAWGSATPAGHHAPARGLQDPLTGRHRWWWDAARSSASRWR